MGTCREIRTGVCVKLEEKGNIKFALLRTIWYGYYSEGLIAFGEAWSGRHKVSVLILLKNNLCRKFLETVLLGKDVDP
jgi:hypothetical protein